MLPKGHYIFLLFAGLIFIFVPGKAQKEYSLTNYNEDILPQTTVGNIQQDDNGYLWMSTQFGIVRFDGEKVRVFNMSNVKGLLSNRIRLCAKGFDKQIYFVDEKNVILKVTAPNQFEVSHTNDLIKESILPLYATKSNNDIGFLEFGKKTPYKQVVDSLKFDLTKEFVKSYVTSKNRGYLFYEDPQKRSRLCYYDGENYSTEILDLSVRIQHTFKLNNFIFHQTNAKEATLFLKSKQKQKIDITGLPSSFDHLWNEEEQVVFSNESGTFFYASGKLYQYIWKDNSIEATLIFENLPCQGVVNVMQERTTGDYMISTASTGFFRVKEKKFSTITQSGMNNQSPEPNTNPGSNIVYALNLWDPQHIFCSGYILPVIGSGLSKPFALFNKTSFNNFFHYPKDKDHIWLNFNDSLQSFNKATRRYKSLMKLSDPKYVIELSKNKTLILTARKIIALQGQRIVELCVNDSLIFLAAQKVSEDCLVIGTEKGIYYFYPSLKKLVPVQHDGPLKVRFIFKDRLNKIWFTTYGQGLFHLTGHTITGLPVDPAGYLNIGHSIFEDNSGYFWIPTNHGLFKVKYASMLSIIGGRSNKLYYTYFDKTDGFNTNEFNGGCFPPLAYQKETGLLFLPSMEGIVKFHPDSIRNILSKSTIFFDEISLNDTGHLYTSGNKFIFPKQISSVRLYFSSPYFGHKENIKFAYNVSNTPGKWINLEDARNINLNNLQGGSYTVTIKKEEATGIPTLSVLSFKIEKSFAESNYFILLLLLLAVGLVYLYFRARLLYLGKERRRLEKEVVARTKDQLNLLSHKEKIIAVLIHDIKSPLYFLNTVATHLDKNIEHNTPLKNKEISNGIATSLNSLYLLTQDFSIWLNATRSGHIQEYTKVSMEEIIEQSLEVYKEIIDKKSICIHQVITCKFIHGDKSMIMSVIRNLIDNAIKNTVGGNITVKCRPGSDMQSCKINIADDGIGMSEERIEALNTFFQSGTEVLLFSTSGFGHKVIKDFLQRLGGDISYSQNNPRGILVTVRLPLMKRMHNR